MTRKTAEDIIRAMAALKPRLHSTAGGCFACGLDPIHADDCLWASVQEWVEQANQPQRSVCDQNAFQPNAFDNTTTEGNGVAWPVAPTLLDLCRDFDAIDLSECNRRLEAGEKFDADCDAAMEKRQALGEQIKERLGDDWAEFEVLHDARQRERNLLADRVHWPAPSLGRECGCRFVGYFLIECDKHLQDQAVRVLSQMIGGAAQEMCAFSPDCAADIERARNAHARLGVLLS